MGVVCVFYVFYGCSLCILCILCPNWLGAGTPSALGVTVAHPQGRAGPGCLFFYKYTCYVTRRVTDLLDGGSTFCVGQLFGANPNIVHRGPCPAGAWGVLPSYGLLGKLTVLCPLRGLVTSHAILMLHICNIILLYRPTHYIACTRCTRWTTYCGFSMCDSRESVVQPPTGSHNLSITVCGQVVGIK